MRRVSPEKRLARVIQGATGRKYTQCLVWAKETLRQTPDRCGDRRITPFVCDLPPGPHPDWLHGDSRVGLTWPQSRLFPFSGAVQLTRERGRWRGHAPQQVLMDEVQGT